jgi:hypothetical protein
LGTDCADAKFGPKRTKQKDQKSHDTIRLTLFFIPLSCKAWASLNE